MREHFLYKINSGKPNKMKFFVLGYLKSMVPSVYFQKRLNHVLEKARKRDDYEYIQKRVDYYIQLNTPFTLFEKDEVRRGPRWLHYRGPFSKFTPKMFHSAYYLDQLDVTRWFPQRLRWDFCPGDVYFTPPVRVS